MVGQAVWTYHQPLGGHHRQEQQLRFWESFGQSLLTAQRQTSHLLCFEFVGETMTIWKAMSTQISFSLYIFIMNMYTELCALYLF